LCRGANKTRASGELCQIPESGIFINNKLVVESLLIDLLAESAEIKHGDIIVSVNEKNYDKKRIYLSN
jgi:C-terminal processing protease CtpA/Prc